MAEENVVQPVVQLPKPTTADDLLSMYEDETNGAPEGEEAPEQEVAPADIPESEPEPEEDEETEEPESAEEERLDVAPSKEYVTLKAKFNNKDIDIPADATFSGQINGKQVEIKAKDCLDFYLHQEEVIRNNDRRTTHLTQRETALKNQFEGIKEKATQIVSAAMQGDFFSTIKSLAKLAKGDSSLDEVAFEKAYLGQITQFTEAYQKLTPEQRDKFFSERKAKLLEEELQARNKKEAAQREVSTLEAQVMDACERSGVTKEVFWDTFKSIKDNIVGEGKQFKTDKDIGIQDVIRQIKLDRQWKTAYDAAEAAGLERDEVIDEVARLAGLNPELGVNDFVKMIKDAGLVPKESVENLNRKAKKSSAGSNKGSSTKKEKGVKGYDDEDLAFLERHKPRVYKPIIYR